MAYAYTPICIATYQRPDGVFVAPITALKP